MRLPRSFTAAPAMGLACVIAITGAGLAAASTGGPVNGSPQIADVQLPDLASLALRTSAAQPSNHDALLVKYAVGAVLSHRIDPAARAASASGHSSDSIGGGWVRVAVGADPSAVRVQLRADPWVVRVTRDRERQAFTQSDPLSGYQDYLGGTMDFPQAWRRADGHGVTVAVVDTGVDASHPDLGRVLRGHDFIDGDANPNDLNGHGTFVAGIIAAKRGNGRGVAGASRATILPVRALDAHGVGHDSGIAASIRWAATHGADVINLSLGGFRSSPVLASAVRFAQRQNVLVVAAGGNSGSERKTYPAALPGVMSVGATDSADHLAWFSERGPWLDVVAPGWKIASTFPGDRYAQGSGTSFAAPLVSAAAALVVDKHPHWTATRIQADLIRAAADVGPVGPDTLTGFGVIDVDGALGGASALRGQSALGSSFVWPALAHEVSSRASHAIDPEGGSTWYHYGLTKPRHVVIKVATTTAGQGVLKSNPAFDVYDDSLHLIDTVDRWSGARTEQIAVPAENALYIRVYNHGPTRSVRAFTVTTRAHGLTSKPVLGSGPRPLILDSTPRANALRQLSTVAPNISLGRPVATRTLNDRHVLLVDGSSGARVRCQLSFDAATGQLRLTPNQPLRSHNDYSVVLDGLRGPNGVTLPRAQFGFITR